MIIPACSTSASVLNSYTRDGTTINDVRYASGDGEAWRVVDNQLNDWMASPADIVDEGAVPPSRDLIRQVRYFVAYLKDSPAPTLVVPDGNGGIAIEWHLPDRVLRTIEFNEVGEAWAYKFENGRLVFRRPAFQRPAEIR